MANRQIQAPTNSTEHWLQRNAATLSCVFHATVALTCLASRYVAGQNLILLAIGLFLSMVSVWIAFGYSHSRLLHSLVAFLAVTFTLKVPLCLFSPAETHLTVIPMGPQQLADLICRGYFFFGFGFLSLVLGHLLLQKYFILPGSRIHPPTAMPNLTNVFIALVAIFVIQIFQFTVLKLGLVKLGYEPRAFLFPGFSGLLIMCTALGTFTFVTGCLALALSQEKSQTSLVALTMTVFYLAVSLLVGERKPMFLIIIALAWYWFYLETPNFRKRLKPLLPLALLLPLIVYGPVMKYRYMVKRGYSPSAAVERLFDSNTGYRYEPQKEVGTIFKRFNGLDLYLASVQATQNRVLGAKYLINGEYGDIFAYKIMGTPEEVTIGMGSTFWGFWAACVGVRKLFVCGIVLAVVCLVAERIVNELRLSQLAHVFAEFTVAMWIWRLAMGNGMLMLHAKEAIVLFAMVYVFCKLAWPKPAHAVQHYGSIPA